MILKKRGTEFISFCDVCKNHAEVIGFSPGYLNYNDLALADGFYRTDLLFGSGNAKAPLIIVGPQTQEKLKKRK